MSGLASGSRRIFRSQVLAAIGWRHGLDLGLQGVWRGARQHLDQDLGDAVGLDPLNGKSVGPDLDAGVFGGEFAEVVQHQMEDGKLDRLRRRLEEIHKEELEDGNDTAGVA